MTSYISDIAFTPAVKAIQSRKGSRTTYARMEERGYMRTEITEDIAAFIEQQNSVFLGSVSSDNAPYIQHRGGPPGFLKVLGPTTLGFVDYTGNRQFISQGNFAENSKAFLFLIDYVNQRRIKIWGTVEVLENRPDLIDQLASPGYSARPEQAMIFEVTAYDLNCPQHIPRKLNIEDVDHLLRRQQDQIAALKEEIKRLKDQ